MSKNDFRVKGFGLACISTAGLLFGLAACGDSTSADENPSDYVVPLDKYSSASDETPSTPGSSSGPGEVSQGDTPSSSSSPAKPASSSSKKVETVTSEEQLNEPALVVKGACGPKNPIIEKGGMATWEFFRESGDVFDAIMAPYVWNFIETGKTLKGNGMNSVNVTYEEPGTYTAVLNVDGTEVTCDPLQVQGIPITVNSCKADKETAKAGESITWTVDAESEATITGYAWTSNDGDASGSGASGTMIASAEMHKKSVAVTVAVTNSDKTTQMFLCEGVTVLDPSHVDMVLLRETINGNDTYSEANRATLPDSIFIQGGAPTVVKIPEGVGINDNIQCVPRVGADYTSLKVTWDDAEVENIGYFKPAGFAAGKTYSVTTTVTALCVVAPSPN